MLAFVGRLQPLKAPDVAVLALAALRRRQPDLDPELLVVGGASGNGSGEPSRLARPRPTGSPTGSPLPRPPAARPAAPSTGRPTWCSCRLVRSRSAWSPSRPRPAAPRWSRLRGRGLYAVGDGTTGVLLANHQPDCWADVVAQLLSSPRRLAAMGAAAARFAGAHGWDQAAAALIEIYGDLVREPVLEQMG